MERIEIHVGMWAKGCMRRPAVRFDSLLSHQCEPLAEFFPIRSPRGSGNEAVYFPMIRRGAVSSEHSPCFKQAVGSSKTFRRFTSSLLVVVRVGSGPPSCAAARIAV